MFDTTNSLTLTKSEWLDAMLNSSPRHIVSASAIPPPLANAVTGASEVRNVLREEGRRAAAAADGAALAADIAAVLAYNRLAVSEAFFEFDGDGDDAISRADLLGAAETLSIDASR
jgi:hypothetical protein